MPKCQISRYDLVCRTCYQHLRENEISACPLTNSKGFPEKPPDFDLTFRCSTDTNYQFPLSSN